MKAFIRDGRKLLILQDTESTWELPGGRTEKSEVHKDLRKILTRETTEELGRKFTYEVGPIFHAWIRQPIKGRNYFLLLIGFHCNYKSGEITLSSEHKNFRWITKNGIDKLRFENTYKDAIKYYFQTLHK